MIDITEKSHKPSMEELDEFVGNPLFGALCGEILCAHKALCSIEYSGDNVLLGWNVKLHKAGRTLCRLYPKRGFFSVLVVVGRREKERVEALLPQMSDAMQELYRRTPEGMGQRWLLFDLTQPDALYHDVLTLAAIRRASK